MSATRCPLRFVVATVLALVSPSLASAQGQAPAKEPAPSKEQPSYRVQYARTYVTLAKVNLQSALNANKRFADTVPKAQIVFLQTWVAVAEQWAKAAEDTSAQKPYNVALAEAEILEKAAKETYESALQVNRIAPMNPLSLENLRIKWELARLRVAAAKELDPNAPLAVMAFQLERLQEEVAEIAAKRVRVGDLD